MKLDKDELMFLNRLKDLAKKAYDRNTVTFTNFLNSNELRLFDTIQNELSFIQSDFWGGYDEAERGMIKFYNDNQEHIEYPIRCIRIEPVNGKFANSCNHRDFLGAVLNLGIERDIIGDIIVESNQCYLFCQQAIASFIIENLQFVKHTNMKCTIVDNHELNIKQNIQEFSGTISSLRLDSIVGLCIRSSRSGATKLIKDGKVFINNKCIESTSFSPKTDDLISIRGYGKFKFQNENTVTKKGRCFVTIYKFM